MSLINKKLLGYIRIVLSISLFLNLFCFNILDSFAQDEESKDRADTLLGVWNDHDNHDTVRLNAYHNYVYENYLNSNPDSAVIISQTIYDLALKKGYKTQMAQTLFMLGSAYQSMGQNLKALEFCLESEKLYREIGNQTKLASVLYTTGGLYIEFGDNSNALDYLMKSLEIYEKIEKFDGASYVYSALGRLNLDQMNFEIAHEYFNKAYEISIKSNDLMGKLVSLGNMGLVKIEEGDYETGINYFLKSLDISNEMGNEFFVAMGLNNIGVAYKDVGDFSKALEYYNKSLEIREKIGDKPGAARCLSNIGDVYFEMKQYRKALKYCSRADKITEETDDIYVKKDIKWSLWETHKKLGNYKKALEMHESFIALRDSIKSEDNKSEILRQELKYDYNKKFIADSIKNAEEQKLKDAQLEKQEVLAKNQKLELNNKRNQQYAMFGGLSLLIVFLIFMYNRYRITTKQKKVIEQQKTEVESQKKVVEDAHELLEEKNNEIIDSINYAKRLQDAILPPIEEVKKLFPSSFILFKPKDIVSGDFYWMETTQTHTFLAVADCTGHGVPGAMVSVVCANALNKSVNELGKTDPSEILNATREFVIATFAKAGSDVKDGMDISLLAFNKPLEGSEPSKGLLNVSYAGANNPLWIIRNGATEVEEIKADKQPIGLYGDLKPFTSHEVKLNQGDGIYMFSDGYVDQFGGDKGKKMKSGVFKKLLLEHSQKNMEQQKEILEKAFEDWKGNLEQIDDVCVIGVRM